MVVNRHESPNKTAKDVAEAANELLKCPAIWTALHTLAITRTILENPEQIDGNLSEVLTELAAALALPLAAARKAEQALQNLDQIVRLWRASINPPSNLHLIKPEPSE